MLRLFTKHGRKRLGSEPRGSDLTKLRDIPGAGRRMFVDGLFPSSHVFRGPLQKDCPNLMEHS